MRAHEELHGRGGQDKTFNLVLINNVYTCFIRQELNSQPKAIKTESTISCRDAAHQAVDALMDVMEPNPKK